MKDKEFEKLEAMGQDGKAGVDAVKEIVIADAKEEAEKKSHELDYFKTLSKRKDDYIHSLAGLLYTRLYEYEFPPYVRYQVAPTDVGVVMEVSVHDKLFSSAFRACGDPRYDINAVDNFCLRTEYTVSKYHKLYAGISRDAKKRKN